jgi:hypothetical protein
MCRSGLFQGKTDHVSLRPIAMVKEASKITDVRQLPADQKRKDASPADKE